MKTAVEQLIEDLQDNFLKQLGDMYASNQLLFEDIFLRAKEKEKQAHKETWDVAHQAGRFEGKGIAEENWQTFETYWEENI